MFLLSLCSLQHVNPEQQIAPAMMGCAYSRSHSFLLIKSGSAQLIIACLQIVGHMRMPNV